MINALVGEIFLRQIPKHLAAGVQSGTLDVFGSVIRNTSTGEIAGFLQEAAPLAKLAANPLFGLAEIGLEAGQLAQGEVLRRGIRRVEAGVEMLSQLGTANLALSAAGIGIAVAGFALLARRIDRVQRSVDGMAGALETISTKVDQVRQDLIDSDLSDLKALAKALDEGWQLADVRAERQWHDVAKGALSHQSRFELRAEHALAGHDASRTDFH
jgi:hypothetical protein